MQQIKAIPQCASAQPNFLYWSWEKNGVYSVKLGYKLICEDSRSEEASGWTCGMGFGNSRSLVRLNIFLWKACTNS